MMRFFRNLLTQDLGLKLLSLAVATGIWWIVSSAIQNKVAPSTVLTLTRPLVERTFSKLPVTVFSSAEDVHDFSVSPKEVEVTVQGDPKIVQALEANQIHAMVDLTGIRATGPVHKRIEISIPPGVSQVRVDPEEVEIHFPNP